MHISLDRVVLLNEMHISLDRVVLLNEMHISLDRVVLLKMHISMDREETNLSDVLWGIVFLDRVPSSYSIDKYFIIT